MLKQKIAIFVTLLTGLVLLVCVSTTSAVQLYTCPDGVEVPIVGTQTPSTACEHHQSAASTTDPNDACTTAVGGKIECEADKAFGGCPAGGDTQTGCGIVEKYINPIINFLAAAAGMVVVIMIIFGGIQYSSAGGDPAKVAAGKNKIVNAIIAFIAFLSIYSVLQWLVPGGFF